MSRKIFWMPLVLCFLYIFLVLIRIPVVSKHKKTEEAVAKIQAQHITMGDVLGNNPPPVPNQAENDATLLGIDTNTNGIRDDVELILSNTISTSRVRAGELQYAHALQLYLTEVFDKETWRAISIQEDRAFQCLGQAFRAEGVNEDDLFPLMGDRVATLKGLVFNTPERKGAHERAMNFITNFGLENHVVCDVDTFSL
ncbi:hypothetical protein K2Q08_01070 [Patescibacteria group bacterium]|nr:hypothetical protein [Patescibacteria group bacterium]